jgi:hypothetical protein
LIKDRCGCPPPPRVSIEHTDRMLVYGYCKPSIQSSIEAWLFPTASLAVVGEKLGTNPWIGQPSCYGLCREPFFLGLWICSNLLTATRNVAICGPHEIRMVESHMWTKREKRVTCWSGFLLQGVHWFESPRLSDMSTACLWQSWCK